MLINNTPFIYSILWALAILLLKESLCPPSSCVLQWSREAYNESPPPSNQIANLGHNLGGTVLSRSPSHSKLLKLPFIIRNARVSSSVRSFLTWVTMNGHRQPQCLWNPFKEYGGGDKDQEKGLFKLRNPQFSQKKNGLLDVKVLSERWGTGRSAQETRTKRGWGQNEILPPFIPCLVCWPHHPLQYH